MLLDALITYAQCLIIDKANIVNWFKYSSPVSFYPLASRWIPIFWVLAFVWISLGLYWGFFQAPETLSDQKQYYKIIYVHVASAWMSMWLYIVMAAWAVLGFIFNTRLSYMMAQSIAPTGALFTFVALWTGAFWGKTSWGAWWDWDPRMTSELILLFLYLGYMALHASIEDPKRADKASALLAIVGIVMVPVIYLSINCPNPAECSSLHQSSSLKQIEENILYALLLTVFGFWMYSFASSLTRVQNLILQRERHARWVHQLLDKESSDD